MLRAPTSVETRPVAPPRARRQQGAGVAGMRRVASGVGLVLAITVGLVGCILTPEGRSARVPLSDQLTEPDEAWEANISSVLGLGDVTWGAQGEGVGLVGVGDNRVLVWPQRPDGVLPRVGDVATPTIAAIDATTGETAWRLDLTKKYGDTYEVGPHPAVVLGTPYVTFSLNSMHAQSEIGDSLLVTVDTRGGQIMSELERPGVQEAAVVAVAGSVLMGVEDDTYEQRIEGFDPLKLDGEPRWSSPVIDEVELEMSALGDSFVLEAASQRVFSATDGTEAFSGDEASANRERERTLLPVDGTMVILFSALPRSPSAPDDELMAFSPDGSEMWDDPVSVGRAEVQGDALVVDTAESFLEWEDVQRLDPRTGREMWDEPLTAAARGSSGESDVFFVRPVGDDLVFVDGEQGTLDVYSADGWERLAELEATVKADFFESEGAVYVAQKDQLVGLDSRTAEQLWALDFDFDALCVAAGQQILVVDEEGGRLIGLTWADVTS